MSTFLAPFYSAFFILLYFILLFIFNAKPASALYTREKSISDSLWINPNQIVCTIFRLIWNQTEFRLVWYQSENSICSLVLIYLTKFRYLSVLTTCFLQYENTRKKNSPFQSLFKHISCILFKHILFFTQNTRLTMSLSDTFSKHKILFEMPV